VTLCSSHLAIRPPIVITQKAMPDRSNKKGYLWIQPSHQESTNQNGFWIVDVRRILGH
jgi:hypothetical protein